MEIEAPNARQVEAGFQAIERIHTLMSAHLADSDVGRVNRRAHLEPVRVDDLTLEVCRRALHWAERSNGVFDIVRAGGLALGSGEIPRHADQPNPEPAASWEDLRIFSDSVTLSRAGCIDLGGIAKGFAVDQATKAMRRTDAEWGFVNAGGDLRGFGDRSWEIIVADPKTREPRVAIGIRDRALATSAGRREQGPMPDFMHLPGCDRRWSSITVEADNACDADALTKIVIASGESVSALLMQAGARAFGIETSGAIREVGASTANDSA